MLNGISPLISPDLLKALAEMGHGDEIVLADAHFPGHSLGRKHTQGTTVLRADGVDADRLMEAILELMPLDSYADALTMMEPVAGDKVDAALEKSYVSIARRFAPRVLAPVKLERFAFYERARQAYVIVVTGETRKYGNIILKKGVLS